MIPIVGFVEHTDPRARATFEHRYDVAHFQRRTDAPADRLIAGRRMRLDRKPQRCADAVSFMNRSSIRPQ